MAASNQGNIEARLAYVPYVAKTVRAYEKIFWRRPESQTAKNLAKKSWWQRVINDVDGRNAYVERVEYVSNLYKNVFGEAPDPELALRLAYEHWGLHNGTNPENTGVPHPQQSIDGIAAGVERPANAELVAAEP